MGSRAKSGSQRAQSEKNIQVLESFNEKVESKGNSDELYSMLSSMNKNMSTKDDIKDILDNIGSLKSEIDSINNSIAQINAENVSRDQRITKTEDDLNLISVSLPNIQQDIDVNKTNIQNTNVKFEENVKMKQGLFYHKSIDSTDREFAKNVRQIMCDLGIETNLCFIIDVSKFNKLKNVALLTFPTHAMKSAFYEKIKTWKSTHPNDKAALYMNEFLPSYKYTLLKECLQLKKDKKIHAAYSFSNNVYIKKNLNDAPILIKNRQCIPSGI